MIHRRLNLGFSPDEREHHDQEARRHLARSECIVDDVSGSAKVLTDLYQQSHSQGVDVVDLGKSLLIHSI